MCWAFQSITQAGTPVPKPTPFTPSPYPPGIILELNGRLIREVPNLLSKNLFYKTDMIKMCVWEREREKERKREWERVEEECDQMSEFKSGQILSKT